MTIDSKNVVLTAVPPPEPEGEAPDEEGGGYVDGGGPDDEGERRGVSRQTLERTPGRLLVFLRGVGTQVRIRAKMMKRGYTPAEHARGWALLQASSGRFDEAPGDDGGDGAVQEAIAEIDAWDEDGMRIVNAALRARHPAQHAFVMRGLKPSTGVESVIGVATLLDRLDALEGAPERGPTRDDDHAALATLAARGVTKAERSRLRARVKQAQALGGAGAAEQQAEVERRVHAALVEQHRWLEEWSDVARSVIKRRDHLIRLGLASRRPRRGGGAGGPVGGPVDGPADGEGGDDEGAE
ncbi:MAG TPA: hypothetical protein VFS43_13730 [Polyangiaceae bacterium]|nr:hypothetical protein [Polyangiaceae bacterium]